MDGLLSAKWPGGRKFSIDLEWHFLCQDGFFKMVLCQIAAVLPKFDFPNYFQ